MQCASWVHDQQVVNDQGHLMNLLCYACHFQPAKPAQACKSQNSGSDGRTASLTVGIAYQRPSNFPAKQAVSSSRQEAEATVTFLRCRSTCVLLKRDQETRFQTVQVLRGGCLQDLEHFSPQLH